MGHFKILQFVCMYVHENQGKYTLELLKKSYNCQSTTFNKLKIDVREMNM